MTHLDAVAEFIAQRTDATGLDPDIITGYNDAELLMSDLRKTLASALGAERVRALHSVDPAEAASSKSRRRWSTLACGECGFAFPCPTVRALGHAE